MHDYFVRDLYIEEGLKDLKRIITEHQIQSITIPPLGAGNGGLDWQIVKNLIVESLSDLRCDILVLEPGHIAASESKITKLTDARALLLYMLRQLQLDGQDATQFAAVKLAYFLQKFGASDIMNLRFQRHIYGPYCDSLRHMLYKLDGAFIRGFGDMSKKPFEPFDIIADKIPQVSKWVNSNPRLKAIAADTCKFLNNRWDEFNLELLSSVDFLLKDNPYASAEQI